MTVAAAATGEHLFWIVSRAAGIVALLTSQRVGRPRPAMGGRMIRGKGVELRSVHEALSIAAMAAIVLHAGALVFDGVREPRASPT